MNIVLYYLKGSRAQRVRWILEELHLKYEIKPIDLFKGEGQTPQYLKVHPLGQVPAVTIDEKPLIESGAIVQWFADSYLEKGLAPDLSSPYRREYDQWMYFAVTNLEMPAWEIVLHGKILPEKNAVKAIIPFATHQLLQVMAVLENELRHSRYLVNDNFSAADILVSDTLRWLPEHLSKFKKLESYVENLKQRPAYIRSNE